MIIKLDNRALIKVTGDDATTFLQSQFSNDISLIEPNQIQINAYCQHQGKILALLWIFIKNENYYLSFPNDLNELVLSKLNMFKLLSKVTFEDFSSKINQYGLIDENYEGSFKLHSNLSLFTTQDTHETNYSMNFWEKSCIDNNLPEINSSTSEQFIPQALNLDVNDLGVSFTKGCYPGQEVVARMHYLGKSKRRLFRFLSKFEANVGDSLHVKESISLKSSGIVLRVAKIDDGFHILGTFEIKHVSSHVYLNGDSNKPLMIINAE